jgi:peptidoglycan/LPS O-acetylase OafA/YrhL
MLFCILVVGPLAGEHLPGFFRNISTWRLLEVTLMHEVWSIDKLPGLFTHLPYPDVNGSAWTLRYEFSCYLAVLVFGVIGVFKRANRANWIIGILFVLNLVVDHISGLHLYSRWIPWYGDLSQQPRFMSFFFAGSLFYLLRDKIRYTPLLSALSVLAIVLCHNSHLEIVLPIAGSYLLFAVAFSKAKLPHFGGKLDLSYGMYLYGWPVEQLLIYHFRQTLNPYLLFCLALPIAAACAWASWSFVERPALKLISVRSAPKVLGYASPKA